MLPDKIYCSTQNNLIQECYTLFFRKKVLLYKSYTEDLYREKIMAEWLNKTFNGFDNGVFNAMHTLAEKAGGFFTPFFKIVSFMGKDGIIFFILSIILNHHFY